MREAKIPEAEMKNLADTLNELLDQAVKLDEEDVQHFKTIKKIEQWLIYYHVFPVSFEKLEYTRVNRIFEIAFRKRPALKHGYHQLDEINNKKYIAAKEGHYERAAKLRDQERKLYKRLKAEIIECNKLDQVFNACGKHLLVLEPSDKKRNDVLRFALHNCNMRRW